MGKARRRDRPEPESSGERLPPRPPIRVGGGTEELSGANADGWERVKWWPLTPEQVTQLEKAVTWPPVNALEKVARALNQSGHRGQSRPDSGRKLKG